MPQSIRVLHVDDESGFGDLTATCLERQDDRFTVQTATSAAEGLASIREHPPDCIVSDYDMPDQTGIEFLESVREEWPDVPFILFTGKGSEEVASDAISAGVTDYLQKERGTDQYAVLANRILNTVERVRTKRQQERQLEAIENAQEGISILDEDGSYLYVNKAFADIHGYDPDELVGEHWELVYPDEDISKIREKTISAAEHVGNWRGETTGLRADGTAVDVDHTLTVTNRGELVCTARDVSEKKEREQRLRQSVARLEALFENSPDMISIHDLEGNIVDPNPRLCEKTGYDAATLTDMKIWELDQRINEREVRALLNGMDVGDRRRLRGEYQQQSGSTVPVEVHIQRLDLAGENRFAVISRDITERIRTEKTRQQIINRMSDAVVEVDPDWQITLVNNRTEEFSGQTEADLVGRDFWAIFADARGTRFEDEYRHAMDAREEVSVVDYYSGVDEWFDVRVYPNEDGGLAFYFQTITEYKERQRELERTERRYRAIFDAPDILAGILDTDGKLVEQNQTAMEYVDAELDDVVGEPFWETPWWPDDFRTAIRRKVERAAGGEYVTYEADLTKSNGDPYNVSGAIRPVTDGDGEVVSLVVSARDITKSKQYERELEELTSQYEALIEHFPNGAVFLFDDDLRYIRAGGTELSTVGLASETFQGKTPYDLFSEEIAGRTARYYRAAFHGEESTYQQTYQGEDYEVRTIPIRDDTGDVIYGMAVARNVTQEIKRKRDLKRQNERLEEFASVVSHDLRNPLQVAQGNLELAQLDCDSSYLDGVADALDRSQMLIDDLLTFARSGDTVGNPEQVSLSAVAKECWEVIPNKSATLTVETSQTISANRSRLRQLLENLLTNAVEHGGEGVTIRVGALSNGFYVADDGAGIPPADRESIFESGYSTGENGAGLGLQIVKQVVDAHDWKIRVTDSESGGTRFDITEIEVS